MNGHLKTHNRQGSVLPLVAVTMSVLLLILASVVDMGWIYLAKNQLQNAADSIALASAAQLIDEDLLYGSPNQDDDIVQSRDTAEEYAAYNEVVHRSLQVDRNDPNAVDGGVVLGYIDNPNDPGSPFLTDSVPYCNTAQVTTRLDQTINGPLGLFLGAVTGMNQVELAARSMASIEDRIIGFRAPGSEELDRPPGSTFQDRCTHLDVLPFSVYYDAWKVQTDGDHYDASLQCPPTCDHDDYSYDEATGEVHTCGGGDGIPEVKMYPYSDDVCGVPGVPGNFGTVDIGPPNNPTPDLIRQILDGVSADDLAAINGLVLTDEDDDGVYSKWLNGDTGVSSAISSALEDIIGESRLLPLHRDVMNPGNNAMFEEVGFVGVRIMDVHMTGSLSGRYVVVQPCLVHTPCAVFSPNAPHSGMIFVQTITRH